MRILIQGQRSYDIDLIYSQCQSTHTELIVCKRFQNIKKTIALYPREDDSIPLADGDPADFVEDSLVSEDKRKVGGPFLSNDQTMMMYERMMNFDVINDPV